MKKQKTILIHSLRGTPAVEAFKTVSQIPPHPTLEKLSALLEEMDTLPIIEINQDDWVVTKQVSIAGSDCETFVYLAGLLMTDIESVPFRRVRVGTPKAELMVGVKKKLSLGQTLSTAAPSGMTFISDLYTYTPTAVPGMSMDIETPQA